MYEPYNTEEVYQIVCTTFFWLVCIKQLIQSEENTGKQEAVMNVNFNKRDPLYEQVVRHFKEEIAAGILEPGQEVPSRRELANQLKINPNTAQRAYKEMEEQGLIHTESNLPSKITRDLTILGAVQDELLEEAISSFISAIRPIRVPLEKVIGLIKEKYVGGVVEEKEE